jgi:hypothetical protein
MTNIRVKQLREGDIYFGSWFQRSQSVVVWLPCFQAHGKTDILPERHGRGELLTWQPGSKEEQEEAARTRFAFINTRQ